MSEEIMTVDELCAFLKVKKRWIYSAAARGYIPSLKVGHELRFIPSKVIAALERGEQQAS